MKTRLVLVAALLLLLPLALFAEGAKEMDFAGAFPEQCADCHGSNPVYPNLGARESYNSSSHNNFGNSYYANGSGCQQCHTNEGFVEWVNTGKVEGHVANPSQPNCFTCHDPHGKGDMSLRTTKPVTLADGTVFNAGDGNLCASCHQARRAPDVVEAMEAKAVSSHFGAHHGPQSNFVAGTGAYEYPGKSYSSSVHGRVVKDSCVDCHMALPDGRYSLSPEVGGHSFNILGEVHEAEKANVSGCVGCHKDIKQVRGTEIFDIKAKADYDNDGTVEPAQAEVEGLLAALVNPNGTGLLQTMDPPMFKKDADGTFHGLGSGWAGSKTGKWSEAQIGALFNYKLLIEDRSLGVHNYTYSIQVLYDTIEALDPSIRTSARRP